MRTLFTDLIPSRLQGKILWGGYIFLALILFFYSFTQVDLNLTLSPSLYPLFFQEFFKHIGYFQRPFSTGLYISLIGSFFACFLGFYYVVGKKYISQKNFWPLLLIMTGILTLSYNAFSYDLFNYIFDARIFTYYQQNPYLHSAQEFTGDSMLQFMRWVHRTYPYGPVWLAVSVPLSYVGFQVFFITQLLFKILSALSFLGTVYFLGKIQERINPRLTLLSMGMFAFNPLVLIEGLVSAHNDMFMLFFAVVALYFLLKQKKSWMILTLLLSIGVKFATVFLLPVFLYTFWKGKRDISPEKIILGAIVCMGLAVIAVTIRTNFQPWYLLYVIPFASLLPNKAYISVPVTVLSFFALLQYVPYIYLGTWDSPVPTILMQLSISSVIIACILTKVWYAKILEKI